MELDLMNLEWRKRTALSIEKQIAYWEKGAEHD
jgi:hypothetical protein